MNLSAWVIMFVIITGVAISVMFDEQEEDRELARYCEMVELNNSDKSIGWPDYRNVYDEVCK